MKKKKVFIAGALIATISLIIFITVVSLNVKSKVKEMFRMNKALQEEGYYMADFEFKLLGCGYYLGKWEYLKAWDLLSGYHKRLLSREGLVRIPKFNNKQDEINFYLELQNPNTGAFIDENAPYCTYWEISQNIINHLESLKDSTAGALKLKYPLKFLDEINTPERLTNFLEDVSYTNWLANKFPQTAFHFARNVMDLSKADNVLERNKLYTFSPEWKHTLLKWMYDFQDSTTGLWGPKDKSTKELLKLDLNNSASILKYYRDTEGNDLYAEFPLRYSDKLFKTTLEQLSEPMPGEEEPEEIHEWNLRQNKGINMLLRFLWKDASAENKKKTEQIILRNIDICFKKYYVKEEGAFSYYPYAKHASPDGTTNLIYSSIGAFSTEKQKRLWGDPFKNVRDVGTGYLKKISAGSMDTLVKLPGINSIRIYVNKPDYERLTENVWGVYYPKETNVLDLVELVPNLMNWIETTSISMGNWTSIQEIKKEYSKLNIKKGKVFKGDVSFNEVEKEFAERGKLFIIGFDKMQVPRCKFEYRKSK